MFDFYFTFYAGPTIDLSKDEYRDVTNDVEQKEDTILLVHDNNILEK